MSKATFGTLSARCKELNKWAHSLPMGVDRYERDEWQRGYDTAEVEFATKLRTIMSSLPKGFNLPNPSLKTQAKERFLQWKRNLAQAEWKKLSAVEQERWEAYVTEGAEFGTIRERELAREAPFEAGDRVALHHNLSYLGVMYPAGAEAKISRVVYDEVREEKSYMIWFDDQRLVNLNAYAHEIRKV